MSKIRGLVNRIIRFSSVDGPGNRLVIFLQGCNMDCINCHNPHTIGMCDYCGRCVTACPAGALQMGTDLLGEKEIHFDESVCQNCDHCLEVCPQNSNPRSRWMSIDELVHEIRSAAPFLSGITVSGGEASQQLEFVYQLFATVKQEATLAHLTTFIDSNGTLEIEGWEKLLPVLDGAMIDLKAIRPEAHRRLTGLSNEQVLRTIRYLEEHQKLHEVRLLIVPGFNDQPTQIAETIDYLSKINLAIRIRLIPFRLHGVRESEETLVAATPDLMEQIRDQFVTHGFENLVVT